MMHPNPSRYGPELVAMLAIVAVLVVSVSCMAPGSPDKRSLQTGQRALSTSEAPTAPGVDGANALPMPAATPASAWPALPGAPQFIIHEPFVEDPFPRQVDPMFRKQHHPVDIIDSIGTP